MSASTQNLLIFLCIGILAGWLAGRIMKGSGFGLLGDMVVGVIGAFFGGWLFAKLGIVVTWGLAGTLITALVGALVLLFLIRLVKRA
jgi:uncharacterized membrane protein YeaQ/YmgE (transglycosylase-associated protein family)